MKAIGSYNWIWAGGADLLRTTSPIYGYRKQYLPMRNMTMTQVQVKCLGALSWINVDPHDVVLAPPRCYKKA